MGQAHPRGVVRKTSSLSCDEFLIPAGWGAEPEWRSSVDQLYGPAPDRGETAKLVARGLDVTRHMSFIHEALNVHNHLRRRHGAPPLKWSAACAARAQLAANGAAAKGSLPCPMQGRSCFQGTAGKFGARDVVEAWYGECESLEGDSAPPFAGGEHFSQLVWKSTLEVGMACDHEGKGFVVAHYWPPGNVPGAFDGNVLQEWEVPQHRGAINPPQVRSSGSDAEVIVSFPGAFEAEWNEVVGSDQLLQALGKPSPLLASCVFLPRGDVNYGEHSENVIDGGGLCFCQRLYGSQREWGCRWFELWRKRLEAVLEKGQRPVVVYKDYEVGQGDGHSWEDLPLPHEEERPGLGVSQAAEVALLKKLGISWIKREVQEVTRTWQLATSSHVFQVLHAPNGHQRLFEALEVSPAATLGLRALSLSNAGLMEEGSRALAELLPRLGGLQRLLLTNNDLGREGALLLNKGLPEQMPSLRELWVGSNELGEEGAVMIAHALNKLPCLEQLWMGGNYAGAAGAVALSRMLNRVPKLEKLGFGDNGIGHAGALAFAQGLSQVPQLQALGLGGNGIAEAGAAALAQALPRLPKLHFLDLSQNGLREPGARALAKHLHHLQKLQNLDLSHNNLTDEGIEHLANEALPCLEKLQALRLDGNNIGEEGAECLSFALQQLRRLQRLGLADNRLGNGGMAALAAALPQLTQLQALFLHNNEAGDYGAVALAQGAQKLASLHRLSFSGNALGREGMEALLAVARSVPKLKVLLSAAPRLSRSEEH